MNHVSLAPRATTQAGGSNPADLLDELADEYAGKVKICKMDVDSNQETPAKFNVRGIPTLILFKDGNIEATKVGALSKTQLVEFIDASL